MPNMQTAIENLIEAVRRQQSCELCLKAIKLDEDHTLDYRAVGCGCDDQVFIALEAVELKQLLPELPEPRPESETASAATDTPARPTPRSGHDSAP
jgi:hypothetical protein